MMTDNPRFRRLADHVVGLGPRAVAELLSEIGEAHGIEGDILDRLQRYARLDSGMLAVTGGDRFAPMPLRAIAGGRV